MNIAKKVFCRIYQFAFHIALPVLPYREPKILKSNTEIAKELIVSVHTAKAHVCSILQKMCVNDRVQAAVKAVKEASKIANGNGGGRKDFAQAGGKDVSKIDDVLNFVNNKIGA